MPYLLCRLALLAWMPLSALACAADLPADERIAMVEDSLRAAAADDSARHEQERLQACLDNYNLQFRPLAAADTSAQADTVPAELVQVVAQQDYEIGENPDFARTQGWPVSMPELLPGSLLPCNRIVAYYGNPLSTRMGVLGEFPKDDMLQRFQAAVADWNARHRVLKKGLALTPVKFGISFTTTHLNQAGALVNVYADIVAMVRTGVNAQKAAA